MEGKEVIITGVQARGGAIEFVDLQFDKDMRLIPILGEVGTGKTTVLQSAMPGKKMPDKHRIGDFKYVTNLLDGEHRLRVKTTVNAGKYSQVLYCVDRDEKKIETPMIDGIIPTASKYLSTLETGLSWNLPKIMSENPTDVKKMLLKLFQHQLTKVGVIFDKGNPQYRVSILGRLEDAEDRREKAQHERTRVGGIAEHLLSHEGINVKVESTIPDWINTEELQNKIQDLKSTIAVKKAKVNTAKDLQLQAVVNEVNELKLKVKEWNLEQKKNYKTAFDAREKVISDFDLEQEKKADKINVASLALKELIDCGYKGDEVELFVKHLPIPETDNELFPVNNTKPANLIEVNEKGQVIEKDLTKPYIKEINDLGLKYRSIQKGEVVPANVKVEEAKILFIEEKIKGAKKNNDNVTAANAFFDWQVCDIAVKELQNEYVQLLAQVNTGVEGLKIEPIGKDIFLMYNGEYNTSYFGNPNKEYRKLSSYSHTQKPMICLLIQKVLLDQKPKGLRYMFIDDIPIDMKTRQLLENMCHNLNLRIFVNITGNFSEENLKKGEILIKNGKAIFIN